MKKNVLHLIVMERHLVRILILLPILFTLSCGGSSVYIPRSYTVDRPPHTKTSTSRSKSRKTTERKANEFSAPYSKVWLATIESVKWLRWPPAFVDESDGVIRLKEAYVYKKSGKLFRTYTWPSKEALQRSDINYYVEKVGRHSPKTGRTVFTQENLKLTLTKRSDDLTTVDIDYTIRPYTFSGKIGYEIDSNGYIESLLLERMRETLDGRPLARN